MKGCGPMKISQEEIKKIALLSRLEVKEDKNILLLEEINRKLDLILKDREEGHGETNY